MHPIPTAHDITPHGTPRLACAEAALDDGFKALFDFLYEGEECFYLAATDGWLEVAPPGLLFVSEAGASPQAHFAVADAAWLERAQQAGFCLLVVCYAEQDAANVLDADAAALLALWREAGTVDLISLPVGAPRDEDDTPNAD